ncbi:MAG: metal-dependent hydrolase [Pseudomonadota bacterium]
MSIDIRIPVRRMDFDFGNDLPKYWYKGNPWITHYLNALSAVFPDGERFFIDSVRNVQGRVQDQALLAQVRSFIGQEANHGKEHEAFNNLLEDRHGVPMRSTARFTKNWLLGTARRLPKMRQLAITIALEHFTAILANQLLEQPEVVEDLQAAEGDMLLWHAVEETEHKAVAFDVYTQVYGRGVLAYLVRILTMIVTTLFFFLFVTSFQQRFLWRDRQTFNLRAALGFLKFIFVKPGPLTRMIPDYLDYFSPSFHPWQHDNRALIGTRVEQLRDRELRSSAA